MYRRALEVGPAALVPLAWAFTVGLHRGLFGPRSLRIAHGVMVVLLIAFAALGRREMTGDVLAVWLWIILLGIPLTAAGLIGAVYATPPLLALSLYGWMILPALGLIYTGLQPNASVVLYAGGGALSLLGAVIYAAGVGPAALGLATVGVGQTVGIIRAAASS